MQTSAARLEWLPITRQVFWTRNIIGVATFFDGYIFIAIALRHAGAGSRMESESRADRTDSVYGLSRSVTGSLDLLSSLSWTPRYSVSFGAPIVSSNHCLVLHDLAATRRSVDIAFGHPNAIVVFPIAWDMLLVGRAGNWDSPLLAAGICYPKITPLRDEFQGKARFGGEFDDPK